MKYDNVLLGEALVPICSGQFNRLTSGLWHSSHWGVAAHSPCLIYCSAGNDSNVTRRMKCWKNDNVNMAMTPGKMVR